MNWPQKPCFRRFLEEILFLLRWKDQWSAAHFRGLFRREYGLRPQFLLPPESGERSAVAAARAGAEFFSSLRVRRSSARRI